MKFLGLIVKNIGRNAIRSILTALGTMMLVFVVTLVWAILAFLNVALSEKNANFKAIITERWQIPSQMPYTYASTLCEGAATKPDDVRPMDSMTWQFYGGSIEKDRAKRGMNNVLFAFSLEPIKLLTMMDDLDNLPSATAAVFGKSVKALQDNRQGIILGRTRMETLKKKIGDTFTIYSMNYKDIDLEVTLVGEFPEGRYNNSAAINRDYLLAAMDAYQQKNGKPHAMANKSLNLVWLKVPDSATLGKITAQIESSPLFSNPQVKCETASSGIAAFIEPYRDLIWGMRYLLAPAILVTLSLVISNSISISVRERRSELAVLKVLGFRPNQILTLVLGEAILIGALSGLISSCLTYGIVNFPPPYGFGGIKFPIAFFAAFSIPLAALWWGPALGAGTALVGSFVPAWGARSVKVSEVFSRVG